MLWSIVTCHWKTAPWSQLTISGKATFDKERSCSSLSFINTTLCQPWADVAWCSVIQHIFMLHIVSLCSKLAIQFFFISAHTHNYFIFWFLKTTMLGSTEILLGAVSKCQLLSSLLPPSHFVSRTLNFLAAKQLPLFLAWLSSVSLVLTS